MNDTYPYLNEVIRKYFFRKYDTGEVNLFFGETDLQAIADENNLSSDDFLSKLSSFFRNDWTSVLTSNDDSFQGFGLIFLQTYAAYLMQKHEQYTENKYSNHLENLLKIDTTRLQGFFRANANDDSLVQDYLWQSAQTYLKQKGYHISIPQPRTGKGRFVQYPLSQSLLNTEDLKVLTPWFEVAELSVSRRIGLKDFILIIQRSHSVLEEYWSLHAEKVLNKFTTQKERIYAQIFNFYQNWDGKIYRKNEETGSIEETEKQIGTEDFLLQKKGDILKLYSDFNSDNPTEITMNADVLKLLYKNNSRSNKLAIFTEIEGYKNEFELTGKLEIGEQAIIMINRDSSPNEFAFLQKETSCKLIKVYKALHCYELTPDASIKNSFLNDFIRNYPFRITGGLKITRKSWMQNCGPFLQISMNCELRIEEEIHNFKAGETFSFHDYPSERYIIKVRGYTSSVFIIEPAMNNCINPPEERKGWNVNNWEIDDNYNLQGLRFSANETDVSSLRSWINLNTNHKKSKQDSIVLQALKRAKSLHYGK